LRDVSLRFLAFGFLAIAIPGRAEEPPPTLVFSTYLGGSAADEARSLAVDASGAVFVVGQTDSTDFPVAGGLGNPEGEDMWIRDAFLFRLAPGGGLVFSTYFGEPMQEDRALDVALDAQGRAYVADSWIDDNRDEEFSLRRVDAGGVSPDLIGERGDDHESFSGMAIAPDGTVYLTGLTCSESVFGINRFDRPTCEGFLLASDGSQGYEWVLLLGWRTAEDVAVDPAGNAYLIGLDWSTSNYDAFVAKIDPSGNYLYTTVFGGTRDESGWGIDVDPSGNAHVTGITWSSDFPVTGGVQASLSGPSDAFVAKLAPSGALVYSTYLGGAGIDLGDDIVVEAGGRIAVVGTTWSPNFPQRSPITRLCPGLCGTSDAFITRFDPSGSQVVSSTLLGGGGQDEGRGIEADPQGSLVVAGWTDSIDFPTVNAAQAKRGGASDAFVAKLKFNHPPVCSGAAASPSVIWPPDRRQVRISTLGVTDPDGDPVTLKVTRILQDELFTARMADAGSLGTAKPWVRADRMDSGDGRVYHLFFEATDPSGAKCTGEVKVCVPLQSGGTCRDGGARIDSTQPR